MKISLHSMRPEERQTLPCVNRNVDSLNSAQQSVCVHLVVGPTGSGKSVRADELADQLDAPVVVADRLQCLIDMPVSTARPIPMSPVHRRVLRYYLPDRSLHEGPISGQGACAVLIYMIGELSSSHNNIVVEGGSISTIGALAGYEVLPFEVKVVRRSIESHGVHLDVLRSRARSMILCEDPVSGRGLIEEVADAWRVPAHRELVQSVNGPEAVIDWCREKSRAPDSLVRSELSSEDINELIEAVAAAHLFHALDQDISFATMFPDAIVEPCSLNADRQVAPVSGVDVTAASDQSSLTITVLCGSRKGKRASYGDSSYQLGTLLAERRDTVCYGGAPVGLMGMVADGAVQSGGRVVGVIPRFLMNFDLPHRYLLDNHIVPTLAEQKSVMLRYSDIIVVLPGGLGILYELFEFVKMAQLGLSNRVCVLVNVDDFFEPLIMMLRHLEDEGFISKSDMSKMRFVPSVAAAEREIENITGGLANSGSQTSIL